jgi:hypothetical protein
VHEVRLILDLNSVLIRVDLPRPHSPNDGGGREGWRRGEGWKGGGVEEREGE